jgi:hypothetical protein
MWREERMASAASNPIIAVGAVQVMDHHLEHFHLLGPQGEVSPIKVGAGIWMLTAVRLGKFAKQKEAE